MDANRGRYHECVLRPFRRLLDATAPAVIALDPGFDTAARSGKNFSRINRDTRFAKDKTPYRAQMYLKFGVPFAGDGETGELYAGLSAGRVSAGFRIYAGSKYRISALAQIALPRLMARPRWIVGQKRRLQRRYESYWYATQKGEWTEQSGWPASLEEWTRLRAWIVRRKLAPAVAVRSTFPADLSKIFREVYPLLRFACLRD